MSWGSYESKIVIDFKQNFLPKERTLKGYLNKINEYFEVNLNRGFYNMHELMSEAAELEMIMNLVKAFIIFECEVGEIYYEIEGHKIYIKRLNLGGVKR